MCDVKIFVSHRIGVDSALPDCKAYIPVLCGTASDKSNAGSIIGDNTGDNISDKKSIYGEFTVQYWAWKNTESEYVGLCHYRRYFSFAERRFKAKKYDSMIHAPALCSGTVKRFCIEEYDKILKTVKSVDAIIPTPVNVKQLPTENGIRDTVREMWDAYTELYKDGKSFSEILLEYIERLAPQYFAAATDYLNGEIHHGFNCYIMKRELFCEMCEFEFSVMKSFEEDCRSDKFSLKERSVGYLGEALNGIYIHYLLTVKNVSYKELQLVFFRDTKKCEGTPVKQYIKFYVSNIFDTLFSFFFPRGSKRRKKLKKLLKR